MHLRFLVQRRIKQYITQQPSTKLQSLDEAAAIMLLTQLSGKDAVVLLQQMVDLFPGTEQISLINLNKEKKFFVLQDERRKLVEISPKNLFFFGNLSKPLVDELKDLFADAVVNADHSSSELLHLVAASIKSRLKCGMFNPFGLPLYNPLIIPQNDQTPLEYILTVNDYLKSLTGAQ